MRSFIKLSAITFALALALAGCKSADEKAEEHFQSGLALIEQGDFDRAVLEFRNVFQLNFSHLEARRALARMLRNDIGDPARAYRQYLRLAEQYPEEVEARIALSEIAFSAANWEEVERHGTVAEELAPEDPQVQAITAARAYRAAALAEDEPERRSQARTAAALLADQPENTMLRNIMVDHHLRESELDAALAEMDWLLECDPDNQIYWRQRLGILAQQNDIAGVEAQLIEMVDKFPEESENKQALIRFYLSRGQNDEVETFLREQIALAGDDAPGPTLDLLRFLQQIRGADVMREELDKVIATQSNPVPFRIMRAVLDFEEGQPEEAIAALEEVISTSEPSDEVRAAKLALARILLNTGNEVGARARVEEVLAEDATNAEALKMQAAWQIEADETDQAVANLRTALDTSPDDAQAMTLMAQAYARAGRPELSRDFLSLAVEASGNAPAESIRYARLLMEEERYVPAEDTLLPALRLAPRNVDLLVVLGDLYVVMEDNGRLEQVIRTLRNIDAPAATQAATRLEAALLNLQGGDEEVLRYLEDLAGGEDATVGARVALIRARIATGEAEAALALAKELEAEYPESPAAKMVLAAVEGANGNLEQAETLYRALIAEDANRPAVWLELVRLKGRQGELDAAKALLDEALQATPEEANLLWAKASFSEREGDIDGAIAVYETLYARNSSSVIVANNLASLLSTYKDDDESLDRAWTVARRFRDSDVPHMQDTYGWIAHRRGNSEEALPYLENAAAALDDPIVQYHLGQIYRSLGREEDALAQFQRAVDLAGPADERAQIIEARRAIAEASQAPAGNTDN